MVKKNSKPENKIRTQLLEIIVSNITSNKNYKELKKSFENNKTSDNYKLLCLYFINNLHMMIETYKDFIENIINLSNGYKFLIELTESDKKLNKLFSLNFLISENYSNITNQLIQIKISFEDQYIVLFNKYINNSDNYKYPIPLIVEYVEKKSKKCNKWFNLTINNNLMSFKKTNSTSSTSTTPLTEFNTTSQLISTSQGKDLININLASNFYLPDNYNYFNFQLYGGGGAATTVEGGGGGGGGGGFIFAYNIPFIYNDGIINTSIVNIYYTISGGGVTPGNNNSVNNTIITITYSNGTNIILNAGSGLSNNSFSNSGGSGGINTIQNTTSFYDTNNTNFINSINGKNGGDQYYSGTSNGYTASGSGYDLKTQNCVAGCPPVINNVTTPDGILYTLKSVGGGFFQPVSGYGAGGASVNNIEYYLNTDSFIFGSPGCVLYWLS